MVGAGQIGEFFAVPGPDPRMDEPLYRGTASPTGIASDGDIIASLSDAQQSHSGGALAVTGYSAGTNASQVVLATAAGVAVHPVGAAAVAPPVLQQAAGLVYPIAGGLRMGDGTTVPYPSLSTESVGSAGPPLGYKGVAGQVTRATGLSAGMGGSVMALLSSGRSDALWQPATGMVTPIPRYSGAGPVVLGGDGRIYCAVWDLFRPAATVHVVSLSTQGTDLVDDDTGVATAALRRVTLLPDIEGATFAAFAGDETSLVATVSLLRAGAQPHLVSVVSQVGLDAAPAAGGSSIYLFGGVAQRAVSELNLSTGVLTRDVPELRAPPGSFVLAVGSS